jgi:hypothetical protein
MKIEIKNGNERVYMADYGTPTIQLGDGGTTISDVHSDDGFHGVCFSECNVNDGVGADRSEDVGGKTVDEIGAYLQIITTNPASIDVLINKLKLAKKALISSN